MAAGEGEQGPVLAACERKGFAIAVARQPASAVEKGYDGFEGYRKSFEPGLAGRRPGSAIQESLQRSVAR